MLLNDQVKSFLVGMGMAGLPFGLVAAAPLWPVPTIIVAGLLCIFIGVTAKGDK